MVLTAVKRCQTTNLKFLKNASKSGDVLVSQAMLGGVLALRRFDIAVKGRTWQRTASAYWRLSAAQTTPLLWTYWWRRFWRFSEDFRPLSEDCRRFSKIVPKARRTFPNIFREFPKIPEDVRRFPKIPEDFRGRFEDVSMIHQQI